MISARTWGAIANEAAKSGQTRKCVRMTTLSTSLRGTASNGRRQLHAGAYDTITFSAERYSVGQLREDPDLFRFRFSA